MEIAREVLERRDAGFRIVGFVDNRPELVGESIINPRVVGLTRDLPEIVRREDVDRIIVAQGERRGQFPTEQLLALSLGGAVAIEEGASFYERALEQKKANPGALASDEASRILYGPEHPWGKPSGGTPESGSPAASATATGCMPSPTSRTRGSAGT